VETSTRALQAERLRLGVQARDFMETELYGELVKRLGEKIDDLNGHYWGSWKVDDNGKTTAYLTGQRTGLTMLTQILDTIFSQGETTVFEIQKDKLTKGYGESY
jgi:hypothetical protein